MVITSKCTKRRHGYDLLEEAVVRVSYEYDIFFEENYSRAVVGGKIVDFRNDRARKKTKKTKYIETKHSFQDCLVFLYA